MRTPEYEDIVREVMFPECYDEGVAAARNGGANPYETPGDIWQDDRAHCWRQGWWAGLEAKEITS